MISRSCLGSAVGSCILGMLLYLSSCSPKVTFIQKQEQLFVLDFTAFSDRGFLFTPEKYLGEYQSIGSIEYHFRTSAKLEKPGGFNEAILYDPNYGGWVSNDFIVNDGLEKVYKEVTEMGGDAIMNLEIVYLDPIGLPSPSNKKYIPEGYIVKGFAIKRLK